MGQLFKPFHYAPYGQIVSLSLVPSQYGKLTAFMKQLRFPWPVTIMMIYLMLSFTLSSCSSCPLGPSSCPCNHTSKPNSSSSRQPSGALNLVPWISLRERSFLSCPREHPPSPQTFPKDMVLNFFSLMLLFPNHSLLAFFTF